MRLFFRNVHGFDQHFRHDQAGGDAIHRDALRGEFHGERAAQADHAHVGGGVDAETRRGLVRGNGDDIDDAAAVVHALGRLLRPPPLGLHVERELLVELFQGDVRQGVHFPVQVATCIVHHDVEAAELGDNPVEYLGDGVEVHHVRR